MSTETMIKLVTPGWLLNLGLTERMAKVKLGFDELEVQSLDVAASSS